MAYPVTGEKRGTDINSSQYAGGKRSNASDGRVMKQGSKTITRMSNPEGRTSYVAGGFNTKSTARG